MTPTQGKGPSVPPDEPTLPPHMDEDKKYVIVRCRDDHITDRNATSIDTFTKFCLNEIDKRKQKTLAWLRGFGWSSEPVDSGIALCKYNYYTAVADTCQTEVHYLAICGG